MNIINSSLPYISALGSIATALTFIYSYIKDHKATYKLSIISFKTDFFKDNSAIQKTQTLTSIRNTGNRTLEIVDMGYTSLANKRCLINKDHSLNGQVTPTINTNSIQLPLKIEPKELVTINYESKEYLYGDKNYRFTVKDSENRFYYEQIKRQP